MKVIVSAAMSIDGYIDDSSSSRLVLSSQSDLAEIQRLRASCNAILVGAGTIRADDPSLVTKSEELRALRRSWGLPDDPIKVTISNSGEFDPSARFFQTGVSSKLVFCSSTSPAAACESLNKLATVVPMEGQVTARKVVQDLKLRGVRRLLVEGGSSVLTMFFAEDVVDEFRLAVAPFFVGDSKAPRLVKTAEFPSDSGRRMSVEEYRLCGDTIAITYSLRTR